MPTESLGAVTADPNLAKSEKSQARLAKDLDTFMLLLTTQLKHQDPLSPMDTTEFTNQLVQFANVEQHIQANSNLERLIEINNANLVSLAVGYIGKRAEVESEQLPLQNGEAEFTYTLSENVANLTIAIEDENGTVVWSKSGNTDTGKHTVVWDGKNSAGQQLEDGIYRLSLTVQNKGEGNAKYATTVFGDVTGLTSDGGALVLDLGGIKAPLGKVVSVHQPTTKTAGDGSGDGGASGGDGGGGDGEGGEDDSDQT